MAAAVGTKLSDVTRMTDVKRAVGESTQANAAYAHMLADESASRTRAGTEKNMDQMNRAADSMFKAAEEAAAFGRGNAEAFAKAAQIYVSGMQDLTRQAVGMVQGLTEQAVDGAKALSGVRSLKEAAEVQAGLARATFERVITETTKLQETALKVAEQSFAPLSARATLAVEKMSRPIAA
jgi:phasin family protein